MLAYYVEWHTRQRLKPMLFDDEQLEMASAMRSSAVTRRFALNTPRTRDASRMSAKANLGLTHIV